MHVFAIGFFGSLLQGEIQGDWWLDGWKRALCKVCVLLIFVLLKMSACDPGRLAVAGINVCHLPAVHTCADSRRYEQCLWGASFQNSKCATIVKAGAHENVGFGGYLHMLSRIILLESAEGIPRTEQACKYNTCVLGPF